MRLTFIIITGILLFMNLNSFSQKKPEWFEKSKQNLIKEYENKVDQATLNRLKKGIDQVADFWRAEDGDNKVFEDFVKTNFAADKKTYDELFNRYEYLLEKISGHFTEISRELRQQTDLDIGTVLPVDEVFAGYDVSAHLNQDFFENKIAFVALLNFPLTTLEERIKDGKNWTRRQWAETRLAHRFAKRIPSEVNLEVAKAFSAADVYIADYNIYMHHVIDENGTRYFPPKMKLLSHWNLRDELKSNYAAGAIGLKKQQIIQKIMERIIDQSIPKIVINNPYLDWNPFTNEVKITTANDFEGEIPKDLIVSNSREPDTRYEILLGTFKASKLVDPYSPTAPSLIDRQFNENRELPEERVKNMLEAICSSPLRFQIAAEIKKRLGRDLQPFDIWYNGFKSSGTYTQEMLDKITKKKYPDPKAFEKDIPNILRKLGFRKELIKEIADNIVVDPARGSGHAMGGGMRDAKAHLRTRIGKDGMDYKGYNIAIHELGHNVEQVLSMRKIDHYLLNGVPNTAFTEGFAFVFQARDKELLGLEEKDKNFENLFVINDFWMTYEIAGVALVDMEVWHWMYKNPDASPEQLRDAVIEISKDVWNKFYADVFNKRDVTLLGIYSHMIHSGLYLPDYPIGHLIAFQIEQQMKKAGNVGREFERMVAAGSIAPDLWMMNATGQNVGPEALIKATEQALKNLK